MSHIPYTRGETRIGRHDRQVKHVKSMNADLCGTRVKQAGGPAFGNEFGINNSNSSFKLEGFMKLLQRSLRKSKTAAGAAISRRLEETIESTEYWAKRMPREAVRALHKERLFGIASGGISLLTGLLVWPAFADSSALAVPALVSGLSGLAALTVAAPYISGLSDRSEDSIKLGGAYGAINRELLRAREAGVAESMKNASQLSEIFGQFDCVEERRDFLGIPVRPPMLNAYGVPLGEECERPVRALPIAPRKYTERSVSSARMDRGRTVVVDQDAVATLIYLLANQLASQDKDSTVLHRSFPVQSEIWEEAAPGHHLDSHRQLALPFESSRSSDSGR